MLKRIALLIVLVVLVGCKGKTGPSGATGPTGPTGPTGTDGTDAPVNGYTAIFQTGELPSSAYSGTTMSRVDSSHPMTGYSNDGSLYFGGASAERSGILIKFDVAGYIPANATIDSAALELVVESGTNLGAPVTVGAHEMKTSGCPWTPICTWNWYSGTNSWDGCSTGGDFNSGVYNAANGTAVLPTTYNGATNRIGLIIAPSVISDWLAGNNNGLAVVSEHMGSDTTGLAVFASPTDSNVSYRPVLKVNYSL